jgi:hypothetical protein
VNINLLLNEYKNLKNSANDDGVNFMTYMKNVLSRISNALGGLNNFILSTAGRDQNTLRIVDTYYLEKKSDKYEFDLIGLGSICRSVDIESQIFPEQSTIVAVAAQSRANLGDIYNSTQVYLNAGIKDRVALAKYQQEEEQNNINKGNPNNAFYAKLFDFLLYVRDNIVGADTSDDFSISTNNSGTVPSTFLKQFMLKYNGELNFKALIPFKLTIKLDGIGGIIVGEIFKVKQNVLPRNYSNKNLGFIITDIQHELIRNDWETTLTTQICLLDAVELGKDFIKDTRQGFKEYLALGIKDSLLYPALVSFMEYQALKSFFILLYDFTNGKEITINQRSLEQQAVNTQNTTLGIPGDGNAGGTDYEIDSKNLPLRAMSVYLGSGFSNEGVSDYVEIDKVWNVRSQNALRLEENSSGNFYGNEENRLVLRYDIDEFPGYLQKWIEEFRKENPDTLQVLVSPSKTLDQTFTEIISEPYYSETLLPISNKIVENINVFSSKPELWNGVIKNVLNIKEGEEYINYTQLSQNIENIILNKQILSNNVVQSYKLLPFENGSLQSEYNPINNDINEKLYILPNYKEPSDQKIKFDRSLDELIRSWYNSMSGVETNQDGIDKVINKNVNK